MRKLYILFFNITLLFIACTAKAQDYPKNFYKQISSYDLSTLWRSDKLYRPDDDSTKDVDFPEPLGYIDGVERQRFYIHYLSVWKDKTNSYLYHVTGKTRIKNDVLKFNGTILVQKASYDPSLYFDDKYMLGDVVCQVELHQDSAVHAAGLIKGKLTSRWLIDRKNKIHYNALGKNQDNFSNNQFTGRWNSYFAYFTKKCVWGDFRVPDSDGLDLGASEFMVSDDYVKHGWETYMKVMGGNDNSDPYKTAVAEESRKWWE